MISFKLIIFFILFFDLEFSILLVKKFSLSLKLITFLFFPTNKLFKKYVFLKILLYLKNLLEIRWAF